MQSESKASKPVTSTYRIYDAVRELRSLEQIATRETVAELTGLKLSVVDDRLRALVDDGKLKRLPPWCCARRNSLRGATKTA